ncbi:FAD-binding protein [Tissierella creatinini]|nr:FAD-binding protein [Tissierella creatinini]TJX63913.1 FAD-binding protein [Soehngenia saccharolytica]
MTLNQVYNGSSIQQVMELLKEYKEDAKIIAGGTDIVVAMREGKLAPKVLIDISKIEDLSEIKVERDSIEIGAGVTYTQLVENGAFGKNLKGLIKACSMVGSPQIRNKGTIGGNIANAAPAADSIPPLIALGARLKIGSTRGYREVLLEDYFQKLKDHGLRNDELLISIGFMKAKDKEILSFSKLGLRKALAISRATISMLIGIDNGIIHNIVVASGSIGKFPMREIEVEKSLLGRSIDEDILDLAVDSLQESMDKRLEGRSTLPYKRRAIVSLLEEALRESNIYRSEVKL